MISLHTSVRVGHTTPNPEGAAQMQTLEEAMEGTKLQRFAPDLGVFVTWNGSLTFSVWNYSGGEASEFDVWTLMDVPSFDEAVESINSHFAEWRQLEQELENQS